MNILPTKISSNEGLPGIFKSNRKETVQGFYDLMFSNSNNTTVFLVKAPPYAGKSGLAQLLCQKLFQTPDCSVVFLICTDMDTENKETIAKFFKRKTNCSLIDFLEMPGERVIIFDEAQVSYSDSYFWENIIKSLLNSNRFIGLRIVFFASFASLNLSRVCERVGTPIDLVPENIFGLFDSYLNVSKPSLRLKRDEFDEMIKDTTWAPFNESIWNACANHIGVAHAILTFLRDKFHGLSHVTEMQVQSLLCSNELLSYLAMRRGMPTMGTLKRMIQRNENVMNPDSMTKMQSILKRLVMGESIQNNCMFDSDLTNEINLLISFGFIFEDAERYLFFASPAHLLAWLYSCRKDPLEFIEFVDFKSFIKMAIGRMHSSHLVKFNIQNKNNSGIRERQFQMELYSAITSLLPSRVYVIPEWKTNDKKGFIDLMIDFEGTMWFLELLVDGVEALEHSKRFEQGGKYYSSLSQNSKYALVDFRSKQKPAKTRFNFMYISFTDGYTSALIDEESVLTESVALTSSSVF